MLRKLVEDEETREAGDHWLYANKANFPEMKGHNVDMLRPQYYALQRR